MTVIATAVGSVVAGTTIGAGAVGALTGVGLSTGLATGIVGAATLAGVGGVGAMMSDSMSKDAATQQASKRQGLANAAAAAPAATATSLYSTPTTPISSGGQQYFATGGLTSLAKGGVSLQDSDYIIPADVVSALGNGSSKAGARYLDQQFARLNSVGGVGALPESRKLMTTRAKKKAKA